MEAETPVLLEDEVHAEESEDEIRRSPSPERKRKRSTEEEEEEEEDDDDSEEEEAVRLDNDKKDNDAQFFPTYFDGREFYAHLLEPLLQDQTLSHQFLSHSFTNAVSSDSNSRRRLAEESLIQAASNHPVCFPLALLHVVASSSSSSSNNPGIGIGIVDDKIPCAAAVRLKNHVSSFLHTIPSLERNYIKSLTFCLMLSLPSHNNNNNIQLHLREAMAVICNNKDTGDANVIDLVDYQLELGLWHRPLVELVSNLQHATLFVASLKSSSPRVAE